MRLSQEMITKIYTPKVIEETRKDLSKLAQEEVKVEILIGSMYVFGSELATLRLFKMYHKGSSIDHARHDYSVSKESFYFALDI